MGLTNKKQLICLCLAACLAGAVTTVAGAAWLGWRDLLWRHLSQPAARYPMWYLSMCIYQFILSCCLNYSPNQARSLPAGCLGRSLCARGRRPPRISQHN